MHITLVHGTFARHAQWTSDESNLCVRLKKSFDATIDAFIWSGRNSVSARHRAALSLREPLTTLSKTTPGQAHYVVAHSHGGTVTVKALNCDELKHIAGAICIGTPFLIPLLRGSYLGLYSFITVALVLAALAVAATIFLVYKLGAIIGAILGVGVIIVCVAVGFGLLLDYTDSDQRLSDQMELPHRLHCPALILRTPGDEATGILTLARFATWLLEQIWYPLPLLMSAMSKTKLRLVVLIGLYRRA